jgi:hypothetical protein
VSSHERIVAAVDEERRSHLRAIAEELRVTRSCADRCVRV